MWKIIYKRIWCLAVADIAGIDSSVAAGDRAGSNDTGPGSF